MLFRILIVITAFIGFLISIETIRYFAKFKNDMSYFHFLINEITAFSFAIMIPSCILYVMAIFAFIICYVIHGDISFMIEYFSK
jgi:hypothetical protein